MDPLMKEFMTALVALIYRSVEALPLACCLYAGFSLKKRWQGVALAVVIRYVALGVLVYTSRVKGQPFIPNAFDIGLTPIVGIIPALIGHAVHKSLAKEDQSKNHAQSGNTAPPAA